MWENWMEKEMEIFPNFILEKKQKSTIFEFIINPKNGQPILEHDTCLQYMICLLCKSLYLEVLYVSFLDSSRLSTFACPYK